MDRDSVISVLKLINAAYPNFYKNGSKQDAVNLWTIMFADDDAKQILLAVQQHIATNKFAPTIADIRESLVRVTKISMTSEEAWGLVKKSISRYGMYRETEAIESLPDDLAEFVKRFGYKDLCLSENIMADRAHFIKLWEANKKNKHYTAMLPMGLVKQLEDNRKELTSIGDLIQLPQGR